MLVNEKPYQSIWYNQSENKVFVIDQRKLPFAFEVLQLTSVEDSFLAIKEMIVRGAPLIGVTAAYGIYLALQNNPENLSKDVLNKTARYLKSARPTAVNLEFVVDKITSVLLSTTNNSQLTKLSLELARKTEKQEIENCSLIGDNGLTIIENLYQKKRSQPVHFLTHCNAGWLACVDWGTALAPIYKAHSKGIPVHVWVDETRPRNQGARLTAWELEKAGVPCTVIADNTGGHLMQHGMVDMVIVGSDRTTINGDVANKIGTYLKALAAHDNSIPFYVALPSSTIDFDLENGKDIIIEERGGEEVREMECLVDGKSQNALLMPEQTQVANYGFDVTPARFISGLITERGICPASKEGILSLFTEYKKH